MVEKRGMNIRKLSVIVFLMVLGLIVCLQLKNDDSLRNFNVVAIKLSNKGGTNDVSVKHEKSDGLSFTHHEKSISYCT